MIYFIQSANGPIKIGFTDNLVERIDSLQVGNPSELRLLALVEGDKKTEAILHELFVASHIRGEWYRNTQDIVRFMKFLSTDKAMTFTYICSLEPRLILLYKEIRRKAKENLAYTELLTLWYTRYKKRLCTLVGWDRRDTDCAPEIYSEHAYDVCYSVLNSLLLGETSEAQNSIHMMSEDLLLSIISDAYERGYSDGILTKDKE